MVPVPYPMLPDALERVGRYLYPCAARWGPHIARDLLCAPKTVRNWATGKREVPGPAVAALRLLVAAKMERSKKDLLS